MLPADAAFNAEHERGETMEKEEVGFQFKWENE